MKVNILLISLLASLQFVSCHECPSYIPKPSNGTRPPLGDSIPILWSALTPALSPLGLVLRDTVLTMWRTSCSTWLNFLLPATLTGIFLINSDSPASACFYAKVVNGSDVLHRTGDGSDMVEAFNSFSSIGTSMVYESFVRVAERVGCGSLVKDFKADPEMEACSGHPEVYRIKQMWYRKGAMLPCLLHQIILRLYDSKSPADRYLALAFTSALDDRLNGFTTVFDNDVLNGMNALLITSSVPHCCCEEFVEAGKRQFLTAGRREISKSLKAMASSTPVRPRPCTCSSAPATAPGSNTTST